MNIPRREVYCRQAVKIRSLHRSPFGHTWMKVPMLRPSLFPTGVLTAPRCGVCVGWTPARGEVLRLPVVVARGARPGPTVAVLGGVHRDEYERQHAARAGQFRPELPCWATEQSL